MKHICLLFTLIPLMMGIGETKNPFRIDILYDNVPYDRRLINDWGFSCLVKYNGENILFDTGGNGKILLKNMQILGIDPKTVNMIFLSHSHGDHTGGLIEFLRVNHNLDVCLLKSFPERIKQEIRRVGARPIEIGNRPTKLREGIYSTGELGGWIKEQALVLNSPEGAIVITGCAHPGVVEIAKVAKEITGKKIFLLLGGFHLSGLSRSKITDIALALKKLGVIKVAPTHCSGEKARLIFKEIFGKNYIPTGLGARIRGDTL